MISHINDVIKKFLLIIILLNSCPIFAENNSDIKDLLTQQQLEFQNTENTENEESSEKNFIKATSITSIREPVLKNIRNTESTKTNEEKKINSNPISLTSKNSSNKAHFEGDDVNYDPESGSFIIQGSAQLNISDQGINLSADRIEYLPKESKLKALGNVLVNGKGQLTFSKNLEINLNNNDTYLDGVRTETPLASIIGKEGFIRTNKTSRYAQYKDGNFKSSIPVRLGGSPLGNFQSYRLIQNYEDMQNNVLGENQSYSIKANNITYHPDRIQNNLIIRGASLKFKDIPFKLPIPFYIMTAGDSSQQMFGLTMGNNPRTGAGDFNLGPKLSFVLGNPKNKRALAISPFVQTGSSLGYGGMMQYTDTRNNAMLGYGTSKKRGLAEIKTALTPHNNLVYGWNSYIEGGITKQYAQLNDKRTIKIPFIGGLLVNNGINSFADFSFINDSQNLRNAENNRLSKLQKDSLGENNFSDKLGFRLQESFSFSTKPIFEIGTAKYNAALRLDSLSSARLYTTGDYNLFTSFAPMVRVHGNKFTDFELGYQQLLPMGQSPFGFDQVIQGQQSFIGNGDFNLSKWFSIGGGGIYSISRSDWVSQQIRITAGPEDFKLSVGFDPVRKQFNFSFNLMFNDKIDYRKFSYKEDLTRKKKHRFSSFL